jgi:hypothetical protein
MIKMDQVIVLVLGAVEQVADEARIFRYFQSDGVVHSPDR